MYLAYLHSSTSYVEYDFNHIYYHLSSNCDVKCKIVQESKQALCLIFFFFLITACVHLYLKSLFLPQECKYLTPAVTAAPAHVTSVFPRSTAAQAHVNSVVHRSDCGSGTR